MSWNNIHKLRPQKPKLESEQDLDASTEFLIWDAEFNLRNLSDETLLNMLSQDISSDDAILSQSSDNLEA